jgi:hypothetical protein
MRGATPARDFAVLTVLLAITVATDFGLAENMMRAGARAVRHQYHFSAASHRAYE